MKSTSSYFILLVSFFGLLFLQQYENRNNQRAFYTVPSSGSVNDQTAFAKWLYNTPVSCEIGNHGLLKQTRGCAFNNKTLNEIKNEL